MRFSSVVTMLLGVCVATAPVSAQAQSAAPISAQDARKMSCDELGAGLTQYIGTGLASHGDQMASMAKARQQYDAMVDDARTSGIAVGALAQMGPLGSGAAYAVGKAASVKQAGQAKEMAVTGAESRQAFAGAQSSISALTVLSEEWSRRGCEGAGAATAGGSSPPSNAGGVTPLPGEGLAACARAPAAARKACETAWKR